MPRTGWLAAGSIAAALAAPQLDPGAQALLACALLLVLALGLRLGNTRAVFAAAGGTLVLLRLVLGALLAGPVIAPALPAGHGPWQAAVESLSAPSDGYQRAFLLLLAPAASGEPPAEAPPGSVPSTSTGVGHVDRGSDAARSGEAPNGSAGVAPVPVRVYARLPRFPMVVPGDRVLVAGRLEPPPDGPGFGDYLRRVAAAGTLEADLLQPAAPADGMSGWLERRRRDAAELLGRALPAPQAGFAAAMLVGLRDQVDRDVADAFTAAGLTHIIAISGWNIALVGGTLASLLGFLSRRSRALATLAGIAAYTCFAGAGTSVVRAALMAALALTARLSGRASRAPGLLAVAAVSMLALDPGVVADAGFQLSVAATAGLLAWATPLAGWMHARLRGRMPEPLVASLGVSLAAQAATLPLVLLDFGRLSLIAPLANLLAAPLVPACMLVGALALCAAWCTSLGLPAALQAVAGAAGGIVIGALVAVARVASAVPGASVELGAGTNVVAAFAALGGVAIIASSSVRSRLARAFRRPHAGQRERPDTRVADATVARAVVGRSRPQAGPRHGRTTRLALVALVAACVALVAVITSRPEARLRMTVLDVGQGDAILLQGPVGGRLLVDTGPDPDRLLLALDARLPAWDRRIDVLVLTHPHDDHVGGAPALLERYRVGRIVDTGVPGTGPGYVALEAELHHLGRSVDHLFAGDHLLLDGARIDVWWPRREDIETARSTGELATSDGTVLNNTSIVLDVRYGARRLLLTGDAEEGVDPQLLGAGLADGPRVDVLKVAHHGSPTSTSAELLDAIRPRAAVISVGANNTYGHPGPDTLARLAERGIPTWRTDRDGSVVFSTDGRDLRVEAAGSGPTAQLVGVTGTVAAYVRATGAVAQRSATTDAAGQRVATAGEVTQRSATAGEVAQRSATPGEGVSTSAADGSDALPAAPAADPLIADTPGSCDPHRISGWLFLRASKPRRSSLASNLRPGTSRTWLRLPRSPPSSPSRPRNAAGTSTVGSSRQRRCCTTSTSCSRRTTPCASSATEKPEPAG